jgi:hypothetical protein
MKKILIILLFLLTLNFVYAYDISTLEHYYYMGNGNTSNFHDIHAEKNMTSSRTWTSMTGIFSSAEYTNSYSGNPVAMYNTNLFDFGNSDWTLNYWVYSSGVSGYPQITFGWTGSPLANDYTLSTLSNTSGLKNIAISSSSYSLTTTQACSNCVYNPNYDWYMVTIAYTLSDYKAKVYINGNWTGKESARDITLNSK